MSSLWELFNEETRTKLLEQYPELQPVPTHNSRPNRKPVVRKGNANDMIISIHALERMEERWGISNTDMARLRELGPVGQLTDRLDLDRWRIIKNLDAEEAIRFQLTVRLTDEEIAYLIMGEVNDALIAGRRGTVCPIELANNNVQHWHARRGVWFCWTKDKSRGYACREDEKEGLIVLTTLVGDTPETSQQKLRHPRR